MQPKQNDSNKKNAQQQKQYGEKDSIKKTTKQQQQFSIKNHKQSKNKVGKSAKSIYYIYQVKASKKAVTKQRQCRANAHYSPSLAFGQTARELKNAVKISPGGQN